MEAYCVKCKTKREMLDPQPVFTATGAPATKGRCPVCGTNLFRMGETPAHAGLPRPERVAAPRKTLAATRKSEAAPQKVAAKATAATGTKGRAAGNAERTTARRKGKLVIVESPAKAKTVGRFLGRDYNVRASVG